MKQLISYLILILFLMGCRNATSPSYQSDTNEKTVEILRTVTVEREYFPTEDWKVKTPSEVGLDESVIEELIEEISNTDVYTMLIIKDGYLVEEYYKGSVLKGKTAYINSVTKSITSILTGIAIDNGYIESIEQQVSDFLPELLMEDVDPRKREWTIEHLLTMTIGLDWNEIGGESLNDMYRNSDDWIDYIIKTPIINQPGEVFTYNSGASHLLSIIIERATNMTTKKFADEYLFSHLNIQQNDYFWKTDPNGYYIGGFQMEMVPTDLAKVGFLLLNGGQWEAKQVISKEWVELSTSLHINSNLDYASLRDYGFQWWVDEFTWKKQTIPYYFAGGARGQHMYIIPSFDFIVLFTGDLPFDATATIYLDQIMQQFIPHLLK